MKRKGIILAGGSGTRMYPISEIICKQLLLIYDKPMIYYPLCTLMDCGVRNILIISSNKDLKLIKKILGNGEKLGIKLSYKVQKKPNGIAEAIKLAKNFLQNSHFILILGDNFFYGSDFFKKIKEASMLHSASIFVKKVINPNQFGVIDLKKRKIIEKPSKYLSNLAVVGIYFYDQRALEFFKKIKKSKRGEYEITDINNMYLNDKNTRIFNISNSDIWIDMGTPNGILEVSKIIAKKQHEKKKLIYCPEALALCKNWITKKKISKIIKNLSSSSVYLNFLSEISK